MMMMDVGTQIPNWRRQCRHRSLTPNYSILIFPPTISSQIWQSSKISWSCSSIWYLKGFLEATESPQLQVALLMGTESSRSFWESWRLPLAPFHVCNQNTICSIRLGWMCLPCFFLLAACYASRLLFGADTMKRKLETANLSMDSWFTGADFPQVAVDQLGTAVRRRYPSSSSNFFLLGWKVIDMLLLHCNTPTTQEVWCEAMLPDWSCVWHLVELPEAIRIAFKLRFKVLFGASYAFWGPIDALFLDQVCFSHLRFLHANYPDRCVFSNITDFVKSADVKISKMRLVSWHCLGKVWLKAFPLTPGHVFFALSLGNGKVPDAWCKTHRRMCPRRPSSPASVENVATEGPPCVAFSKSLGFLHVYLFTFYFSLWVHGWWEG